MFLVHPWKNLPFSYLISWNEYISRLTQNESFLTNQILAKLCSFYIYLFLSAFSALDMWFSTPLGKMGKKGIKKKQSWIRPHHCELDRGRRSNLCDIAATTLWPRSSSSFDFVYKTKYIWFGYIFKTSLFFSISLQ